VILATGSYLGEGLMTLASNATARDADFMEGTLQHTSRLHRLLVNKKEAGSMITQMSRLLCWLGCTKKDCQAMWRLLHGSECLDTRT